MAARVLVSEPLADRGLDAMRSAGLDVDVQTGLSPEELLDAIKGAQALVIRSATQVTAEVLEAAHGSRRRRPGRHRPRQRRRRRSHAPGRDGRERAAVEHPVGGRAHARAAARAGAQRSAGQRRPEAGRVEPVEVGRRRAARQDARHRRPRARRRARRAARARVRHAARRVRPVRERRSRPPARRCARADRRGARRDLRLRLDPRDEDAGDGRPRSTRRCSRTPSRACG